MQRIAGLIVFALIFASLFGVNGFTENIRESEVNRAVVQELVRNYDPLRDPSFWFIVRDGGIGGELNVFVPPENFSVELDRDAERVTLSAAGDETDDMFWRRLNAASATLYVTTEDNREEWQRFVDYARERLRQGLRHLPLTGYERWNGSARLEVTDSFWNFGDPIKIDVPFDGAVVAIDENLERGQVIVDAPSANFYRQSNGQPQPGISPYVHLRANAATIYVRTEAEAREWRQRLNQWSREWDEEQNGQRRLPAPPVPQR